MRFYGEIRNEVSFEKLYDEAVAMCKKLDRDMPALPKRRKKKARLGDFYRSPGSTNDHT